MPEAHLPAHFMKRRMHSLLGVWLSIFLLEHLFTNSQAALYFKDRGSSFVKAVNQIHDVPFLIVIEVIFLAFPFILHALWGIYYLRSSKQNSITLSKKEVSLPMYKRNRAYTWQRVTALILVPAIFLHVYHMRFYRYPVEEDQSGHPYYIVRVYDDKALPTVLSNLSGHSIPQETLPSLKLSEGQILTSLPSFGAATFLNVRDTFKSPTMVLLYSIFVVAASYHGFNGLWTFLISWGITLTQRAQKYAKVATNLLMSIVMLLGLFSIWGTYWTFVFET
jgi:succinate dehydrogenase / fumarate reductase, cytochrome b subunit